MVGGYTPVIPGGDLAETINLWEMRLGRRMDLVNNFRKWGAASGDFEQAKIGLAQAASSGRTPLISWEPLKADSTQGNYGLTNIIAGEHDNYIRGWANGLRDLGFRVYIRFAHEMNGNWYHWCGADKGGQPSPTRQANYRAAWRHIVNIFREVGAHNVRWVWCVNTSDCPKTNWLEAFWPGSDYVDVMGVDGYNGYSGWREFTDIIRPAYERLCALNDDLPIWVVETATPEASLHIAGAITSARVNTKAGWIKNMFDANGFTRVKALCWLDELNPSSFDWRVDTSASSISTLRYEMRRAGGYTEPPLPYIPPAPDKVSAVALGEGKVEVSWRIAPSYVRGYKVLARTARSTLMMNAGKAITYTLTDLPPGRAYVAVQSFTLVRVSSPSLFVPVQVA